MSTFAQHFKNMNLRIILILVITLIVSSCGEYEKLLKSTDYELKKNKVREYYEKGQYLRATELLTQVLPRYRATDEAENLSWINARSYFAMNDYIMAGSEFRNFADLYPYSKNAEEANLMAAMCDYYQSPRAELDQESTKNAITGFDIFVSRYPASPKAEEAKKHIKELQERLVEKSYLSAKLYYEMKQYKAAITALKNSLKDYPETTYRQEMMYLKLSSLYLYAQLSIPSKQKERYQSALDDYYSFIEEFPKGDYSKEVNRIYLSTSRILKLNTNSKPNSETKTNN
jgi:outer membrane protein assembly factor BamD